MKRINQLLLMLMLVAVSVEGQEKRAVDLIPQYDPSSNYRDVKLRGYTIRVNKLLMRGHSDLYKQSLEVMDHQLYKIQRVVPAAAVKKLQTVVIWLEYDEPHHPCAAYHPGRQWLVENGMNPEKVKCVEISNATNFVSWTISQPYMVFHELAHAYHDQFLPRGFENPGVMTAFQSAMKTEKYQKVLRWNGKQVKHYSTTNQMEYFAEATEAYFGTNDYYPFTRPELELFDTGAARAVEAAWGIKEEKK